MEKCICDICDKRVADRSIKAKRKLFDGLHRNVWTKLDFCAECYVDFYMNVRKDK